MKPTTSRPHKQAVPELLYRFEVEDPSTGLRYVVLVGDDGMAYREEARETGLRAVG